MRLGFVTCVQLGLSCMEAVYKAGAELDLIATLPDDRARNKSGRIYVDDFAARNGIPVIKVPHVNDPAAVERFRELDWLFIVGWSQIAGEAVLQAPSRGVIGMHPTLLPEGRGRAAIPWAILKGLDKTGVTMFKLDSGVDTGPIIAQREIPLSPTVTATELYDDVCSAHCELIEDVIPDLVADSVVPTEQDESRATVWPGRRPEDGEIDLDGSVWDAERLVRSVTRPYPGAYFIDQQGRKVIVWSCAVDGSRDSDLALELRDGSLSIIDYDIETP